LPAGLVHSTVAVPGADTRIVKVVPPRPATLPVHSAVVPSSVQTGVPTKCPDCAKAALPKVVSRLNAATVAMSSRAIERFILCGTSPNCSDPSPPDGGARALKEPRFAVEEEKEVREVNVKA
jgi:hypothetical protein